MLTQALIRKQHTEGQFCSIPELLLKVIAYFTPVPLYFILAPIYLTRGMKKTFKFHKIGLVPLSNSDSTAILKSSCSDSSIKPHLSAITI